MFFTASAALTTGSELTTTAAITNTLNNILLNLFNKKIYLSIDY